MESDSETEGERTEIAHNGEVYRKGDGIFVIPDAELFYGGYKFWIGEIVHIYPHNWREAVRVPRIAAFAVCLS